MDRGLIIRATSVQHLPLVVKRVREEFPAAAIDILTHQNAVHSLGGSFSPESIILYPQKGCFSLKGVFKGGLWRRLFRKKYDFIVIPVENIHGSGYENVFRVALSLLPRKVILLNKGGELSEKTFTNSLGRLIAYASLFPVSLLISMGFTLYFLSKLAPPMVKREFRI